MSAYDYLVSLRDELKTVSDVKSCKIGLEKGIGAKDSPFIRIVPSEVEPDGVSQRLSFYVAYGFDVKNKDHEALHELYFSFADSIIQTASKHGAMWQRTVTDEDTVQNLKTAVIEFEVELC